MVLEVEKMQVLKSYPPGVQDLLKWAAFYLQQLDILEHEFRAWQENERVKQTISRTEQARLRWEGRLIGDGK